MLFRSLRDASRATRFALSLTGVLVTVSLASSVAFADKNHPHVAMTIETANKKTGVIEIELYAKETPKTVAHFLDLVNKKFYDGILFHRYVEGFVAQAGDPKSRGMDLKKARIQNTAMGVVIDGLGDGGSGTNVPLEATEPHVRGTLGLARSQDPDSGDSQFFFNLKDNGAPLNTKYCAFGKVTKGLDLMDKLRTGDKIKMIRVVTEKSTPAKKKPTKM